MAVLGKLFRMQTNFLLHDWHAQANFRVHKLPFHRTPHVVYLFSRAQVAFHRTLRVQFNYTNFYFGVHQRFALEGIFQLGVRGRIFGVHYFML